MLILSLLWSMVQSFPAQNAVSSQDWNLTGLKKGQKLYRCAFQAAFPHELVEPKLVWIYTSTVGQPRYGNRAKRTPRSPAPLPRCLCMSWTISVWKGWGRVLGRPCCHGLSAAAAASVSTFPGRSGGRFWQGLVSPMVCPWGGYLATSHR